MVQVYRKTQQEQVYDYLKQEILGGMLPGGHRLSSIRSLARQFGTSAGSVQQALNALERDGYVYKRHGSGTFVAEEHRPSSIEQATILALQSHAHLYGDLTALLAQALQQEGQLPVVVDTQRAPGARGGEEAKPWEEIVRSLARGGAQALLYQGGPYVPPALLQDPLLEKVTIISLLRYQSGAVERPVHRALVDRAAAARATVGHLQARRHKRIVVVGPGRMLRQAEAVPEESDAFGAWLARFWREAGGEVRFLPDHYQPGGEALLDDGEVLAAFDRQRPPTAAVGLRDYDAWLLWDALGRLRGEEAAGLDLVGYGDTPWSRTGRRPFSSVNLNLDEVARAAVEMLETCRRRPPEAELETRIAPRLVVRDPA
jgi:DNA-binding LacI/PurR family transcriptional regulator